MVVDDYGNEILPFDEDAEFDDEEDLPELLKDGKVTNYRGSKP